jgi:ethanolamine utilization cobalamin adenosyltransferase
MNRKYSPLVDDLRKIIPKVSLVMKTTYIEHEICNCGLVDIDKQKRINQVPAKYLHDSRGKDVAN